MNINIKTIKSGLAALILGIYSATLTSSNFKSNIIVVKDKGKCVAPTIFIEGHTFCKNMKNEILPNGDIANITYLISDMFDKIHCNEKFLYSEDTTFNESSCVLPYGGVYRIAVNTKFSSYNPKYRTLYTNDFEVYGEDCINVTVNLCCKEIEDLE